MELELKVNINDLPLEALILIAASKRKVNVKVSNETCLSVKDNVVFSSNISAMRYLANTDQSYKWMGTSALEKCEINHWITYSFGPLSGKDSFEESLVYLDRVIAPVTFLVGDKCSLADIVVWSKLFNLPKWIDLLQSNKTPVNVTRWYTFIASLDYVEEAIRQIGSLTNNLPVEKMKKETKFSNAAPQETGRKDEGKFVELPGAEMGKVVVRFPPEASGYLHIGHAKAALLNQYYKEAFNGQLIMRFDDTNPAKEKEDFEKVILEDLKLLNINYDKFTRTSNYFDVMLEMCEKLIKDGKAYVDDTNAEEMKKEREKKVCSKNRDNTVDKNMLMWNEMKNGTEKGQTCCVRAKIDMSSLNGCMRDPTIYRCKNEPHPLTGNKYKVYPTYDFACPIVDSLEGVTHCLRTMEYHDRDEQFYWFIDVLGLRKPYIWEYSRLNMTNTVLSKRKLTWFVENKYVDGWDDPRMPTVRGVLRRGMTVEGLKQFIIAQGSSRSVVLMEWDKIWAFNKKVIDPIAPRYTAVDALRNVTVSILNVTESSMQVAKHPKNNEVGDKTIWVAPKLLVDEADATEFKENENVTFINWGNITVNKIIKKDNKIMEIVATPNLEDKNYKKTLKITWLADTKQGPLIPVTCLYFEHIISKPILGKDEDFKQYIDHTTMFKAEMLGEPALASVKKSDIIQLQRKGFFICDQPYSSPNAYTFKASPLVLIYIPDGHSKGLPSGLIEVERNPVCASKDNYIEFIKQFIEKEEAVCNMFSAGKESDDLDGKIQELILLKENCDAIISSVGAEIGYEKTKRIHNLLSKVATLARKIRNLKAEKADRNVIEENSKALLELKASYTEITGRPWNSEPLINVKNVSNSKLEMPSQNDQPDKTSLSLKITEAGNKVRKLKADKADKTVIDQHVKLLLKLKADFKSLTGNDWTPDSSSDKTEDKNCSDVNELLKKITEVGNKIRTLKSNKSSKNLIDEEVKVLLQLKCNYKNLTGKEWTPALNVSSSEKQTKTSTDSNDLSNKIKLQGDKVRQLKGNKVEKSIIDAEVKVLLALKSEFKSSTGKDWVPDNTEKKADVKTSGNDSSVLSNKIKLQGDKVRQLKGNKADKSIIDAEVKALLALKSEYKTFTGKDWIPETTEKKTDVKNSGNETKTTNDIIDLSNNIRAQGDKVRQLKGNKADKSIVDAEVKVLLALKSEFKSSTGKDWVPDNTEKTMKNTSETKQMELNSDASSLTNKIKDQGNLVRTLKANSADKHQINEAVEKLLSLKSEYKAVTGQDFPSEGKVPSKKTKNSSDDASKKVQSPKIKASKQENKLESETGLKKITRLGLEAKKEENLPDWYSQIIVKSELIEYYDISGCYILRPWSYAIWEAIKDFFDAKIKLLGVKNCYFPIFVSKAVLEKEKTHIADFAPEVAWVTKSGDSDLAEPIAVRPTSETVMYPAYAKWIQSYRDLPIKLNQWNNVVRWEFKHPQPFLRTREFLWQEGHTAFATYEEAEAEVYTILEYYAAIYTDLLAIPVVKGRKTEKEKFAGGDFTLTVEAYISASGRAIQGGTSHHLGQNFSKMFEIIFEDPVTQEKKFVFQNSWGITTRTIGVLIMVHADNQGLVLPPRVASIQVVIVPCGITASLKQSDKVMLLNMCGTVCNMLKENGVRSEFDERDNYSPGWKFNHWELKGVPIRVELGPKDMQQQQIVAVRRDTGQKITIPSKNIVSEIKSLLDEIQSALLSKATDELNQHKIVCKDWKMFCQQLDKKNILLSPFCGRIECEDKIKEESARNDAEVDVNAPSMGAKSLCIPFEQPAKISNEDRCIHPSCGVKPEFYCLFGRSY